MGITQMAQGVMIITAVRGMIKVREGVREMVEIKNLPIAKVGGCFVGKRCKGGSPCDI